MCGSCHCGIRWCGWRDLPVESTLKHCCCFKPCVLGCHRIHRVSVSCKLAMILLANHEPWTYSLKPDQHTSTYFYHFIEETCRQINYQVGKQKLKSLRFHPGQWNESHNIPPPRSCCGESEGPIRAWQQWQPVNLRWLKSRIAYGSV